MPEQIFDLAGKRVWVAGHRGMVGSAIVRRLASENCEVVTVGREQVDLRRADQLDRWFVQTRPQVCSSRPRASAGSMPMTHDRASSSTTT
jgi:nucleoside-diphosphate-sugar epimerase